MHSKPLPEVSLQTRALPLDASRILGLITCWSPAEATPKGVRRGAVHSGLRASDVVHDVVDCGVGFPAARVENFEAFAVGVVDRVLAVSQPVFVRAAQESVARRVRDAPLERMIAAERERAEFERKDAGRRVASRLGVRRVDLLSNLLEERVRDFFRLARRLGGVPRRLPVPVVRVRRDARQARRLLRAPFAARPRAVVKRGHRGARLAHVLARRFGVRKRAHARFPEFRVARVLPRHPELRGVQRQRGRVRQVDAVFREHRGSVVIAIAIVIGGVSQCGDVGGVHVSRARDELLVVLRASGETTRRAKRAGVTQLVLRLHGERRGDGVPLPRHHRVSHQNLREWFVLRVHQHLPGRLPNRERRAREHGRAEAVAVRAIRGDLRADLPERPLLLELDKVVEHSLVVVARDANCVQGAVLALLALTEQQRHRGDHPPRGDRARVDVEVRALHELRVVAVAPGELQERRLEQVLHHLDAGAVFLNVALADAVHQR
eukprot:31010-Pelagococcus_subviridis.AAC.5